MKKTVSLEKRLTGYTLAAAATLSMPVAGKAAIQYVDAGAGWDPISPTPVQINFGGGAAEFSFFGSGSDNGFSNTVVEIGASSSFAFMKTGFSTFAYVVPLAAGVNVQYPYGSAAWSAAGLGNFVRSGLPSGYGMWKEQIEKHIGVFFMLNGANSLHNGWIKVTVNSDGGLDVLGYAYNDIPLAPILTGQTTDAPLPVELSSFTSKTDNNTVKLEWTTESEKNNMGFILERCLAGDLKWEQIASHKTDDALKGHNTSTSKTDYAFTDNDVVLGETYQYRLSQENIDGTVTVNKVISVTVESTPTNFALKQNYPNPFNPSTTIEFSLQETQNVNLSVYNMSGQLIETLIDGELNAGVHSTAWNAANVPAGTYFYQLQSGEHKEIKKAVLVK